MLSLGVIPQILDDSIVHLKFEKLQDLPSAKIKPVLPVAVEFIKTALEKEGKILVHCYGGMSRSASCVIAYMMTHKGLTYYRALEKCKKKRSIVAPNLGFAKELMNYEQDLIAQ